MQGLSAVQSPSAIQVCSAIQACNGITVIAGEEEAAFTNTYSVDLDGVDDYINADALDLNSEIGTGDISIAFWIKFDDFTGHNYIFYIGQSNNNAEYVFSRYSNSSSKIELVFRTGSAGQFTLDWDTTPSLDTWYHVGFSRTGTTAKLYIDGAMVDSGTNAEIASPLGFPGSSTTTIAAFRTGIVPLNGHIDEFTIWNSILTDAEFAEIGVVPIDLSKNSGDYVSSANVLANWRFEEGTGTSITDSSGNGYTATLTNGPTFSTDVPVYVFNRFSVDFDGTDDYATIADADDLSFGDASTDSAFSIAAWIKMDDATGFRLISKTNSDTDGEWMLNVSGSDKLLLYLFDANNSNRIGAVTSGTLTAHEGSWIHVAATYDGSGLWTGITLYINGVSQTVNIDNSGSYTAMHNTNAAVNIGRLQWSSDFFANGKIDEVAIIPSELSAAQVTAIYNSGEPADLTPYSPTLWTRFEEGTGTSITDSSGNGHTATLTNGPTFSTDVPT